MAIPDYQTIMGPLLKVLSDGKEYTRGQLTENLSKYFKLSEEEKRTQKPSGGESLFRNRVGWSNFYLKKAGLTESKNKGLIKITKDGLKSLETGKTINKEFLMKYPQFKEFLSGEKKEITSSEPEMKTPEEEIDYYYKKIRQELSEGLLERILSNSPWFFEKLVLDFLEAMGYGGFPEAGEFTPKSRDGGIDGIIKQDKLGIDSIYIQAKRYTDRPVSSDEIQKFVGAIHGKGEKGIFITTSYFSRPAINYTNQSPAKIVLIDGKTLSQLMIDYNVGTSEINSYNIKKVDTDYFIEE